MTAIGSGGGSDGAGGAAGSASSFPDSQSRRTSRTPSTLFAHCGQAGHGPPVTLSSLSPNVVPIECQAVLTHSEHMSLAAIGGMASR